MAKKILVVEDEPVVTEMVRFLLESEGYEVASFSSNAGVMAQLQDRAVALVLLDLALGGQDGLDICEHMKSSEDLRHIPLVLLSAHRDLEKIAGECGADGFIEKPFELSGFANKIKAFIR
jgi:two-component system alkaline phosphatase synthesis response regulator PhoP